MGWLSSRAVTVGGFILVSAGLWYFLDGFRYRMMFAAVPVLFAAQMSLSDMLEGILIKKVGWRTKWFTLLIAPGTILHEMCHLVAALATGCTVTKAALFRPNPSTGVLGYVAYTQPDDKWIVFREFMVGFAPFFGCGLLMLALGAYSGVDVSALIGSAPMAGFGGFVGLASDIWSAGVSAVSGADYAKPTLLLIAYLQLCFTAGAAPSTTDFKGAFSSLYRHMFSGLFFLIAAAFVILASERRFDLWGYDEWLAAGIGAILRFTVVVMMLSSMLTAVILPILYGLMKALELEGMAKTVPITSGFLAYYYAKPAYGLKYAAAAAAAVFALSYLLVKGGGKRESGRDDKRKKG